MSAEPSSQVQAAPSRGTQPAPGARASYPSVSGRSARAKRPRMSRLEPTDRASEERALDHDLVRRAQAGEEAAFASLVQRHERRALRVARNLIPSDEDARDLTQEAFLRVFRHLERFDFQYAFSTWLHRIVTNLAIDHLRKRRPVAALGGGGEDEPSLELADEDAPQPAARLEREETRSEVLAVLDTLAPHFKSVMVLRELEGLGCPEIAEIVGATHVTVRWRLHRARKLFLEEWERRQRAGLSARTAPNAERDPS
jgi:RNA polymerase sigma-70 factor (ECF subfamily)